MYMWVDEKGKKSKLSAPQYVDYVMTYVQKTVNDETLFPTKHGHEFPSNFDQILRRIQKLLFHVVAHIYHSHFREVRPIPSRFWFFNFTCDHLRTSKNTIPPDYINYILSISQESSLSFLWNPWQNIIPQIVLLGLHAHLNSIFAHIIEFNLCHRWI